MSFVPSEKEFIKLTKKGNLIPVYKEILGDLETPVSAYFKIASDSKYSFLLESVEGEEKVARFSFLAKDPELIFESKDNKIKVTRFKNNKPIVENIDVDKSPLTEIRRLIKRFKFVNTPGLPRFCGGLVGYLSYDIVKFFEKLPNKTKDDLKLPDSLLILAKDFIIFDHRNHRIKIVNCVEIDPKDTKEQLLNKYKKASNHIDKLISQLNISLKIIGAKKDLTKNKKLKIKSNFTESQFKKIVTEAKKQIRAGEIIQVVLSQRFEIDLQTSPFNIYRTLRALNPSPYMYYLNFDKIQIIGSSPELLVRCEDRIVDTRPIAGTRPRGKDEEHDAKLAQDLLDDPKEKAEHIMLVDLGRNDLGRVCKKGTVHLSEFMNIEKYSHVMHIVSNVRGQLRSSKDDIDVLEAAFPAGTVSGAPKIRAMEIIEDLEKVSRGPYAGCIGYFSFSGNLDTCITIRTIVATNGKAYVQAGAGIVADSIPKKEYQETINKAMAQIKAIELAHKQE
ncbi:MAG: anthranilate synthase component I [Candidatus Omnitrophica bacterium]|nr:anthranilate synthase component I [Candidatus Omnitrophota bacterium]MBU1997658.1 anthranilate synthase component I [Candidatus Omnitrophota bacterium]